MTPGGADRGGADPEGRDAPRAASPLLRWARALGGGTAAILGLLLLAAAGGVLLVTQMSAGRSMAASFLEDIVSGGVNGRVEVGSVTGGNLLNRLVLEEFRISGPEGEPFLLLEGVRVEYNPLDLVRGRYHLRRMTARRMEVRIRQDRDGAWVHERIFEDGRGGPDTGEDEGDGEDGLRLWATDLRVEAGLVEVRTPWEEDGAATGEDAPAGGSVADPVWNLEVGEEGSERVVVLEELRGRLPFLRLADPAEPLRIDVQDLRGRLRAVQQPLSVERLDASAVFGDTVRVELDEMRTAASRLSGDGWVAPGEDFTRFRFDLGAAPLAFRELRWLPVPVPDQGEATGALVLRTDPGTGTLVTEVEGGEFRSGDSRATGGFVLHLEEPPRFGSMELRLEPIRLSLVHRLLGQTGRPDGLVEGRLSGAGPLDMFRVDADLEFRRIPGDGGERAGRGVGGGASPEGSGGTSGLRLEGGIDLEDEPRALGDLRLEFRDFEPRWTRLLGLDTRQAGRLDGRATLDRPVGGALQFTADLRHRVPGDTTSHVRGRGSVELDGEPAVDLELTADPVSLSVLEPYAPELDLVGTIRGPLSATGTMEELRARADLRTPRGELSFDGTFDLAAERRRYDAAVEARGIQLRQWLRDAPHTRLDVRGRVRGEGTDPADLTALFDLELLPSRVQGARIDSSLLRFQVDGGLARIDTFSIRSEVGSVRGTGGIGLSSDRSAALYLEMETPDLSSWNRWIVPGRSPVGPDTTARDLFALLPADRDGEEGVEGGDASPDTLSGSLSVRGAVYGNVEEAGAGGEFRARAPRFGNVGADSFQVVLDADRIRSLDSLVLRGTAWGFSGGAGDVEDGEGRAVLRVDTASFRLDRTGSRSGRVEVRAMRSPGGSVEAVADVEWGETRKTARLEGLSLRMGGQALRLAGPATIAYGETGLEVEGFTLRGREGGLVRAGGTLPRSGPSRFDLRLEALRLADVGTLVGVPELQGELEAGVQVRGSAASPEMEARVRVADPGLESFSYGLLEADFDYRDRRVRGVIRLHDEAGEMVGVEGTVRADLSLRDDGPRLLDDPFDFRIAASRLPLALLLFPADVTESEGEVALDVQVRGGPDGLSLDGEGEVRDGGFRAVPLNVRFREIGGRLVFRGTEMRVDSLGFASAAGGRGTVSGTVGMASPRDPEFDLTIRARRLQAIDRRKASLVLRGEGRLEGSYRRPSVRGGFRVSNGTIRAEEFLREEEVVDLTDPRLRALIDTTTRAERRLLERARNPFLHNLRAEVDLEVGPDLWLRSRTLSVELAGELELRMDRAEGDVRLFGDLRLVRGSYRWAPARGVFSRQLRITGGTIEFVGTPGVDPVLDITAQHRVRSEQGTITVQAEITGNMSAPQLALTSDPPLSESDRVCVLILNTPCAAQEGVAGQLAADQLIGQVGAQLNTLLAGGRGPDYLTLQSGEGGGRTANGEDDPDATSPFSRQQLELGWYLSPELFLTYSQPLGGRPPSGSLEWRFAENWTVELRTEHRLDSGLGRQSESNLETDRLWGMFLFREWSF